MHDLPVNFATVLFGIVAPSMLIAGGIALLCLRATKSRWIDLLFPLALILVGGIVLIDLIQRMNGYQGLLH